WTRSAAACNSWTRPTWAHATSSPMAAAIWSVAPNSSSCSAPAPASACRPTGWSAPAPKHPCRVRLKSRAADVSHKREQTLGEQQHYKPDEYPAEHERQCHRRQLAASDNQDQHGLGQAVAQRGEENAAHRDLVAQ